VGDGASVGVRGVYPNWPDSDLEDWEHAYHGANCERLVRAKARYDPDRIFSSTNRSRVAFRETLHRLEGLQLLVKTGV
jgi:hypothetical protein